MRLDTWYDDKDCKPQGPSQKAAVHVACDVPVGTVESQNGLIIRRQQ